MTNLQDFEGVGQQLLAACLQGNEEMQYYALMAIEEWSKEALTLELLQAVKSVATNSTIKEIRQYAKQILEK